MSTGQTIAAASGLTWQRAGIIIAVSVVGLALWTLVVLATKPWVVRSAQIRRFRAQLRHLDLVQLGWHASGWRAPGSSGDAPGKDPAGDAHRDDGRPA